MPWQFICETALRRDSSPMAQTQLAYPDVETQSAAEDFAISTRGLSVYYGKDLAVRDINLNINRHQITAIIGPSGCGKSTLLRCFNRMNDLIPAARVEGEVVYNGQNVYAQGIDPVAVRRRIG